MRIGGGSLHLLNLTEPTVGLDDCDRYKPPYPPRTSVDKSWNSQLPLSKLPPNKHHRHQGHPLWVLRGPPSTDKSLFHCDPVIYLLCQTTRVPKVNSCRQHMAQLPVLRSNTQENQPPLSLPGVALVPEDGDLKPSTNTWGTS